jgi:hypothetical protein
MRLKDIPSGDRFNPKRSRSKSAFRAVSRRYERAVRRRRSDNPVRLIIIAAVIGMALGLAATALVPSLR